MKSHATFISGYLLAALVSRCTGDWHATSAPSQATNVAAVDASIYVTNATTYPVIDAGELLFERTNVVCVTINGDTYMHFTDAEWSLMTNAYRDHLHTIDNVMVFGPPKK